MSRHRRTDSARGQIQGHDVGEKRQPFDIRQDSSGTSRKGHKQGRDGETRVEVGVNECVEVCSCSVCMWNAVMIRLKQYDAILLGF